MDRDRDKSRPTMGANERLKHARSVTEVKVILVEVGSNADRPNHNHEKCRRTAARILAKLESVAKKQAALPQAGNKVMNPSAPANESKSNSAGPRAERRRASRREAARLA